ncbi:MAG: relaxase/mobilization nuclease domain-containing protein [Candidatus Thiodiazotropha sp. LLP2]
MIIKANQRGFGRELARHLLNGHDNEIVEVHAIRGFASDSINGAFQEVEAISRGTKCRQYIFHVSLSPPENAEVSTQTFEDTISRVANKMGLQDQPHVIVYHEKNARRHCHVVFSRIDAENMKAINLPYYKNRLMEISRDLYLENSWSLPQGFLDREKRNPLNFSLQEWQQARRLNDDPRVTKLILKECWSLSDSKQAFGRALEQRGYYLARGDRRGFVAVDWRGDVYSLSRWCDVKSKALKERLGDPQSLPTVDQTKERLDRALTQRMQDFRAQVREQYAPQFDALQSRKDHLKFIHTQERTALEDLQTLRRSKEQEDRQSRFSKGLLGLWNRVTGRHTEIKQQNEMEAYQCTVRDHKEKDKLIYRQITERQEWKNAHEDANRQYHEHMQTLQRAVFSKLPEQKVERLRQELIECRDQHGELQKDQDQSMSIDHSKGGAHSGNTIEPDLGY